MKSCFGYLLFLLPALVFNSCSNDLEVLADYEENAAIYALLDPAQSVQFIKINKVFTNPNTNALDVARISDSLYFDSIAPQLVEMETNGSFRRNIPLYKANVLLKDSGTFANSPNYLYVTNMPISSIYKYRIDLWLPKTNKYVTASTNMVVLPPISLQQPVSVFQISRVININPVSNANITLRFTSGLHGKIYDAYFNFNYLEVNKSDTNIKIPKVIRWKILRSYRTMFDKGGEIVVQQIPSLLFYNLLLNEIPEDASVTRRFLPCSLEFIAGNQELDNYIQASAPSIGIVQKQTDYSNVIGGVGIFASRNSLFIDQIELHPNNKTAIVNDPAYKPLGFK
jgi:hypothetical protein